jgi:transposase-like protein
VRDALNKVREKNREALAEVLKKFDRAESWNEVVEALRNSRECWDAVYPKIVERWETRADALLVFLRYSKPIRRHLYTTNQLERLAKEVKGRTKVMEVFCGEGAVEKLLQLVLSKLNEVEGSSAQGICGNPASGLSHYFYTL